MKTCSKCKREKSLEDFPREEKRKDGRYPWCKVCLSQHRKDRYVKRGRKTWISNKVCSKCCEDKPREAFRKYTGNTLHCRCISCEEEIERLKKEERWVCSECKIEKPNSDFFKSRLNKISSQCKGCAKEYSKRYDVKQRAKDSQLKKKYGISLENYKEILEKQNYRCAICKRHYQDFKMNLAVEHCHRTGAIRGLCCSYCNTGLAAYHDKPEYFKAAAKYLVGPFTDWFVPERSTKRKRRRR